MSTTTSGAPDHDETEGPGTRPPDLRHDGPRMLHDEPRVPHGEPRIIHNEATTEIPVHLLFRDDPGAATAVPVALRPAVVGRRRGTGEQPRTTEPPRSELRRTESRRPESRRPESRATPQSSARHAPGTRPAGSPASPFADPASGSAPAEFPGRAFPGAVGVLFGAVGVAGCVLALWWAGALPGLAARLPGLPGHAGAGLGGAQWAALAGAGTLALFGFGGLARGRVGGTWVLTLFGRYRGSVRRTGLLWVNPLWARRRVDVRLRHWRSEPMPAVDAEGTGLRVVVLVAWRVRDTARAAFAVEDHEQYLRECVEAATARVLSRFPADAPLPSGGSRVPTGHTGLTGLTGPTLRNTEAVGDALTRLLAAEVEPVGLQVFSAQPIRIAYAPEVADSMRRRRIAALDARQRDSVLTSVVDSVEDTVTRLTVRGLVELDDYERKALVKDLTVAFCTGRGTDAP